MIGIPYAQPADEAVALIRAKRSRYALFNQHFLGYLGAAA